MRAVFGVLICTAGCRIGSNARPRQPFASELASAVKVDNEGRLVGDAHDGYYALYLTVRIAASCGEKVTRSRLYMHRRTQNRATSSSSASRRSGWSNLASTA